VLITRLPSGHRLLPLSEKGSLRIPAMAPGTIDRAVKPVVPTTAEISPHPLAAWAAPLNAARQIARSFANIDSMLAGSFIFEDKIKRSMIEMFLPRFGYEPSARARCRR
jgi:hypothetical protein